MELTSYSFINYYFHCTVSCPVCGDSLEPRNVLCVDVLGYVNNSMEETILNGVIGQTQYTCLKCTKMPVVARPAEVKFPPNLIVHSRRLVCFGMCKLFLKYIFVDVLKYMLIFISLHHKLKLVLHCYNFYMTMVLEY